MSKRISSNKLNFNTYNGILSIEAGGTGASDPNTAKDNLNIIGSEDRNAAMGVAGLDSNIKIYLELIPDALLNVGGLNGPDEVNINSTTNYTIAGYSQFEEYTISTDTGSIIRNGDTVTFVAPATPRIANIILNGRLYQINVKTIGIYINTPSIISPVPSSTNLGPNINFTSSAFSTNGGSDTHEGTDWQIATDANFTNIVASATNSSTDKLSWAVQGLQPATQYFIRTRYKGITMGYSNWSSSISFNTKATYLPSAEEAILTASDKTASDYFGWSVSISSDGSRVAVGAYAADPGGLSYAGKAYIFSRSGTTWTQEAILTASDKLASDYFGWSVSISSDGSRVAVGAVYADPAGVTDAGKAYIFTRSGTTWTQEAILTASDKLASDYFGWSVSISSDGSRCIVGTYGADPSGITDAGKAYIFSRSGTTWTQEAILTASDKLASDYFGYSVSMSSDGSRVAVGACAADPADVTNAGKAYIFTRSGTTWTQEAILTASDKTASDYFGWSVSMSSDGSRVAVGAYLADPGGLSDAGKAYIFSRSGTTWTQEAILTASDKAGSEYFGRSVSMSSDGSRVAVGAYLADPGGLTNAGKAYIFTRSGTTWTQEAILTASDKAVSDQFGCSVSISSDGTRVAVGAYTANPAGVTDAGKAYIFS